jgi:uncharacterized protein YukE
MAQNFCLYKRGGSGTSCFVRDGNYACETIMVSGNVITVCDYQMTVEETRVIQREGICPNKDAVDAADHDYSRPHLLPILHNPTTISPAFISDADIRRSVARGDIGAVRAALSEATATPLADARNALLNAGSTLGSARDNLTATFEGSQHEVSAETVIALGEAVAHLTEGLARIRAAVAQLQVYRQHM